MPARLPLLVLSLVLALTGCTGGRAAQPRPPDEPAPRSAEQLAQVVAAGLLESADVPALSDRPVPGVAQATADQLSETLAACLQRHPAAQRQLAGEESPLYSAQSGFTAQAASSWSGVFPDALAAGADVRRSAEPATVECLRRGFRDLIRAQTPPGVTVSRIVVEPLETPPLSQATESFGYRFTATVRTSSVRVPLQGQFVGAAVGEAALSVYTLVLGEPASPVAAVRLLPELVARSATAQGLQ